MFTPVAEAAPLQAPPTTRGPAASAPSSLQLPRSPVLGWSSFSGSGSGKPLPHSVDRLRTVHTTTSGRAALYLALQALALPPGSGVLVPSYHCPTMVAPILRAGLHPVYFGIGADALPQLAGIDLGIDPNRGPQPRALIVAHYFGLPHSLAAVRAWCDANGIAMIEDCAHCFFGEAGERPVGAWGDFATASISKFFPVPEAGLLASNSRDLPTPRLDNPGITAQVKGLVDVLELSAQHHRLPGLNGLLQAVFRSKNRYRRAELASANPAVSSSPPALAADDAAEMMRGCDMGRTTQAPLWFARQLARAVNRQRIVERRHANFTHFHRLFAGASGARALFPQIDNNVVAPYVYPLWVDDAERVYQSLRALGAPVFRWDRIWPGTPTHPDDHGPTWSRHVLQLLCHQDLRPREIERVAQTILRLLPSPSPSPLPR